MCYFLYHMLAYLLQPFLASGSENVSFGLSHSSSIDDEWPINVVILLVALQVGLHKTCMDLNVH